MSSDIKNFAAVETLYKSESMMNRRRRVLDQARLMLEEGGFGGFTTRELCIRSGIKLRTFYDAFGSKDRVIAQSIYNFIEESGIGRIEDDQQYTLDGMLTWQTVRVIAGMNARAFVSAAMSVYGEIPGFPEIRAAIRDVHSAPLKRYVEHLRVSGALTARASPEWLVRLIITTHFGLLTDWTIGEIDDDQMIDGDAEMFLGLLVGAMQGEVRREGEAWLDAVRGRTDRWETFKLNARSKARVSPSGVVSRDAQK